MAGVLRLPSGRLVRGRGLSRPLPEGPAPAFGLYLLGRDPEVKRVYLGESFTLGEPGSTFPN